MSSYTGLKPVFKREFFAYFTSPMGYLFLFVFILGSALATVSRDYGNFFEFEDASLGSFYRYISRIFIILVPAVAMRLWAEERKSGTVELLFTLPITRRASYLGKFLAAWCFLAFALACPTVAMIWVVERLGDPDWGTIVSGFVACLLTAGLYLGVGMFFSALSKSQIMALMLSVMFCMAFWLIGLPQSQQWVGENLGSYSSSILGAMSVEDHFDLMTRGLVEFRSFTFFLLITLGWILAGMAVLDKTKAN